jgi:hypothetical protein
MCTCTTYPPIPHVIPMQNHELRFQTDGHSDWRQIDCLIDHKLIDQFLID